MTKKKHTEKNVGDISFTFDLESFNKILINSSLKFYFSTITITFIILYFLNNFRLKKKSDGSANTFLNYIIPINLEDFPLNFFFFPCSKSIFNEGYVGMSNYSYLILVLIYGLILYILIKKYLVPNFLYSFIFGLVQSNPNTNPLNNPLVITKVKSDPMKEADSYNFRLILFTLFIILIPTLIINYYSKNKSRASSLIDNTSVYIAQFSIFVPLLIVLFTTWFNYKNNKSKLNIFANTSKYLNPFDDEYAQFILKQIDTYPNNFYLPLIFFVIISALFTFMISTYLFKNHDYINNLLLVLFLLIIPFLFYCSAANALTSNFTKKNTFCSSLSDIQTKVRNGVTNLYQLIIKYNIPCFFK